MSQSISVLALTVTLAASLSARRFVGHDGNYASAAGNTLGVTRTEGVTGDAVAADVIGTAVVAAGGTFAKGAEIEVGADGKAVVQSAGVTVARALEAGVDGQDVEVLLIQN